MRKPEYLISDAEIHGTAWIQHEQDNLVHGLHSLLV